MIELKPCPFCGGNDIQIDEMESFWDKNETIWRVLCINCIAETAGDTKEQAIAAWNRRSDAVPVVRCRECRSYDATGFPALNPGTGWCDKMGKGVHNEFYCANGAKMEDKT